MRALLFCTTNLFSTLLIISSSHSQVSSSLNFEDMLRLSARWELGKVLYELDEFATAADQISQVTSAFPDDPKAQALLGTSYTMLGEWEKAESVLQMALSNNPKNPEMINLLGDFYFQKGDYQTSFTFFEKSLEFNPKQNEVRFHLMEDYLRASRFTEVEQHANYLLIEGNYKNPDFFALLADFHGSHGYFAEALNFALLALKADPGNNKYLRKLGEAYFKVNQFSEAVTCLQSYFNQSDPDIQSYLLLGEAYFNLHQFEEAEKIWSQGLSEFPGDPNLTRSLAEYFINTAQPLRARETIQDLISFRGLSGSGRLVLVTYFRKMGNYNHALDLLKSEQLKQSSQEIQNATLYEEAQLRYAKGDYWSAERLSNRLIKLNYEVSDMYLLNAKIEMVKGNHKAAQNFVLAAQQANPYNLHVYALASAAFVNKGDLSELTLLLDSGLSHMPNSPKLANQYAAVLIRAEKQLIP